MFRWFGHVSYTPCTRVSDFATWLKDGFLMASRCRACGEQSFPPRADCASCLGREFDFVEVSGRAVLHSFTGIVASPTGFHRQAPYTLGLADLVEGGRVLAGFGDTIEDSSIAIGMALQLVPWIVEDSEDIQVLYRLERPGTRWSRTRSIAPDARIAPQPAATSPEEAAR
jgi:uncharacterized OB-fold protein